MDAKKNPIEGIDMNRVNAVLSKFEQLLDANIAMTVAAHNLIEKLGKRTDDLLEAQAKRENARNEIAEAEVDKLRIANSKKYEELKAEELELGELKNALSKKVFEANEKKVEEKLASGKEVHSYDF